MHARNRSVCLLAGFVALVGLPNAQVSGGGGGAVNCNPPTTAPECVGLWGPPQELCISCDDSLCSPTPANCVSAGACGPDEIGHAALIPTGEHAGNLLVFTRCDDPSLNPDYTSFIVDPDVASVVGSAEFAGLGSGGNRYGPFCAGHYWVLDDNDGKKPKYMIVGGDDYAATGCGQAPCASEKAMWFDPSVAESPPTSYKWSDAPEDLVGFGPGNDEKDPVWYPSVITLYDGGTQSFYPFAVGGTDRNITQTCDRYQQVWTLPSLGGDWYRVTPSHSLTGPLVPRRTEWHQYPRTFLLSDGDVFSIGNAITCEATRRPEDPGGGGGVPMADWGDISQAAGTLPASAFYGGVPTRTLTVNSATNMVLSEGVDPNDQSFAVGGLHYGSAVLLHTLRPNYQ